MSLNRIFLVMIASLIGLSSPGLWAEEASEAPGRCGKFLKNQGSSDKSQFNKDNIEALLVDLEGWDQSQRRVNRVRAFFKNLKSMKPAGFSTRNVDQVNAESLNALENHIGVFQVREQCGLRGTILDRVTDCLAAYLEVEQPTKFQFESGEELILFAKVINPGGVHVHEYYWLNLSDGSIWGPPGGGLLLGIGSDMVKDVRPKLATDLVWALEDQLPPPSPKR